ncbi:Oxidoreductase, N-terminal [Sesbania bispinosa]|nr:Oxidoreductase, N-terminal [Sesbania bispinosa]
MSAEGRPIKFGILGCAEIARKLSRAITLSLNATLYAVGSRSLEKASRFAASNGFPSDAKVYASYEAVLDDPNVDAVYVPLPTSLHLHWAVLAAEKKKHLLLEKPVALNVGELDKILEACESNGVQFMDATMWMHHPRTHSMLQFLSDPHQFGRLQSVHATFSYGVSPYFLENDIRVKPDLDALGALGDTGWYCIRAILWAANYELPKTARALNKPIYNEAGVILACGASLLWEDDRVATFYCSFLSDMSMDITAMGTQGSMRVHDYVIPNQEKEALFHTSSNSYFTELSTGWAPKPSEYTIHTDLPQEALMVREFAHLVGAIKFNNSKPENKWPTISRKTQVVIDAVKASIDNGLEPVHILD